MNNPSPTPLDDQIRELAAGLRDVIRETDESYLEKSPEEAYEDLAARLVLRLSKSLTIQSVAQTIVTRTRLEQAEAAQRILDIFTRWMHEHPECHYVTGLGSKGQFELTVRSSGETKAYFQGGSIQDAYAQAAQTINFNGGTL